MRHGKHDDLRLRSAVDNVKGEAFQSGLVNIRLGNHRIKIGGEADMRHDRLELGKIVRAQAGQSVFVKSNAVVMLAKTAR